MTLTLSAKLDRTDNGTAWGFRMAGGKDFSAPLTIQRVTPGSLAARCGIQVGDTILQIGSANAALLPHKVAQDLIVEAGNSLELKLERGSGSGDSTQRLEASHSYAPPSAPSHNYAASPQPAYNITPKPYSASSGTNITSLTSQTASLNFGSPQSDQSVPWSREGVIAPASFKVPLVPQTGLAAWQPKIPTGERKMKVGKAGQAKTLPAIMGTARIPVCSGCGTAIRGPFISALDKTWCPDHFMCANPNCRVPLVNCGFVEEEEQLFCEQDYEKYLAPRCGKCGRAIVGEVVNAQNNTFHMGCFLCSKCNQPIGTGSFHNEDGKIYCPKDWALMFQTKCYGCQFPIEPGDRWVEALSQNWHSECFNCSTCQMNLEGQSFFAKNGKPYCKKHAASGRRF